MTQQYKVIENMAEGIRRKKMISLGINEPSFRVGLQGRGIFEQPRE